MRKKMRRLGEGESGRWGDLEMGRFTEKEINIQHRTSNIEH
jgi:hypothetical protein